MKRDTIKTLAAEIKARWPSLRVVVERGYCSTDRKWKGSRLRHPGKGRWGSRIKVYLGADQLLDHNNAETYRTTSEVREWMERCAKIGRPCSAYSRLYQEGRE